MRILGPVVLIFLLQMLDTRHHFHCCGAIALKFVCDDNAGNVLQPLQKLAKEPNGRFLISAALHEDIQDVAILVHRSPEVMEAAVDLFENFIKVPPIARPRRLAAQAVSVSLTELETPFPNSFIGEAHATHRQHFFNIAEAQSKAKYNQTQ